MISPIWNYDNELDGWRVKPCCPYEKVKAGDVYEWVATVGTRSGYTFKPGERMTVIEPTGQMPFDEIGPDGVNWHVDAANGYTVWSTLELVISHGLVKKVLTDAVSPGTK